MPFTTATAKGQRAYQEDRFITASFEDGVLLAVFDGHGGDGCANYLAANFIAAFTTYYQVSEPKRALRQAITRMFKETNEMYDGSTGSFVWIPKTGPATVAIVGDSPVIIGTKRGYHLSPEHNARTNLKERKAAEDRGAIYSGGYLMRSFSGGGLQMARAFGDASLGFLRRVPEIYTHAVLDFVLVGTDGILDPGHTEGGKIIDIMVDAIKDGATAEDVVRTAVEDLKTGDNATAILWRPDAEGQK